MFVAPMNVVRRDVVPASSDSRLDACDVQFRVGQSHVPDAHFNALFGCLHKEACDGIPAEGGLEDKIQALFNRPLQQPHALAPGLNCTRQ